MKISELQAKDVVDISDGRKLGQIQDLELDLRQGVVRALVIPEETRLFGWISSGGHELVIPWKQIVEIGADVILVRLDNSSGSSTAGHYSENRPLLNQIVDERD